MQVYATDQHPLAPNGTGGATATTAPTITPFDRTLRRFLEARSDDERSAAFKLIPHCAKGSWLVVQSVGTTPVILGRKVAASYHFCRDDGREWRPPGGGGSKSAGSKSGAGAGAAAAAGDSNNNNNNSADGDDPPGGGRSSPLRYAEVDVDVTTNPAVGYIVAMVQGATKSMVIDHAWLLEARSEDELPEALIGSSRFAHLDMTDYRFLATKPEEAEEYEDEEEEEEYRAVVGDRGRVVGRGAEIPMAPPRVGAAAAGAAAYDAEALAAAAGGGRGRRR